MDNSKPKKLYAFHTKIDWVSSTFSPQDGAQNWSDPKINTKVVILCTYLMSNSSFQALWAKYGLLSLMSVTETCTRRGYAAEGSQNVTRTATWWQAPWLPVIQGHPADQLLRSQSSGEKTPLYHNSCAEPQSRPMPRKENQTQSSKSTISNSTLFSEIYSSTAERIFWSFFLSSFNSSFFVFQTILPRTIWTKECIDFIYYLSHKDMYSEHNDLPNNCMLYKP